MNFKKNCACRNFSIFEGGNILQWWYFTTYLFLCVCVASSKRSRLRTFMRLCC